MKLIALRIDEEEKARLEQLAEERNVTLSRALREGAALYLSDRRAKSHSAKGGDSTFLGVRRDEQGRALNTPSSAAAGEVVLIQSLRLALQDGALSAVRQAWDEGVDTRLVLGALGQWLSLVGDIYVGNGTDVGWSWFMRDYGAPNMDRDAIERLCWDIRVGLVTVPALDVAGLLDLARDGFDRFLEDVEHQQVVRREVLPRWRVIGARAL